jgi:hypothetical protein
MIPVIPRPAPGDSTRWHRILSTSWMDSVLVIEVEGRGGTTGIFPFRTFDQKTVAVTGAEARPGMRNGEGELIVTFDPSVHGYVQKTISLRPE